MERKPGPLREGLTHLAVLVAVFTLLSFAYSLGTWGLGPGRPWIPRPGMDLLLHAVTHGLVGAIVSLPSRRIDLMVFGAAAAVLIDADHTGLLFGWPVVPRASHSLGFLVLAPLAIGLVARHLNYPRPALAAAVIAGGVCAHITWDTLATASGMPIWLPFDPAIIKPEGWHAVLVSAAAAAAIALVCRYRRG